MAKRESQGSVKTKHHCYHLITSTPFMIHVPDFLILTPRTGRIWCHIFLKRLA